MNKKIIINSLSIFFGILLGGIISMSAISLYFEPKAMAADELRREITYEDFKNTMVGDDYMNFSDIFGPSKMGLDLYNVVYKKIIISPEKDSLKIVAQKYGLTKDEASEILGGSMGPIVNNENPRFKNMTIETAYKISSNFRQDFKDIAEIYAIQQELDVYITPGELFSNGDLSDSGFDLIYDLSRIEKILFAEESSVTVGKPYKDALNKPFFPISPPSLPITSVKTDQSNENEEIEEIEEIAEIVPVSVVSSESDNSGVSSGENEVLASTTEYGTDICEPVDSINTAFNNYKKDNPLDIPTDKPIGYSDEYVSESESGETVNDYSVSSLSGLSPSENTIDSTGNVVAPAKDSWPTKPWCPGLVGENSQLNRSENSYEAYGSTGFNSIANFGESVLSGDLSAGYATGYADEYVSAQISLCLDTELVYETFYTVIPGQTSIKSEINKINTHLDKTLSHSLVPNKATGNLMESAKCKKAFEPIPDIKFIFIPAPVTTPMNTDLIYSKSIWDEWNNFIDKYQPFITGFGKLPDSFTLNFELERSPTLRSVAQANAETRKTQQENISRAYSEINNSLEASNGTNDKLEIQTLLTEIRQMNMFFQSFNTLFWNIHNNACGELKAKKTQG